jgi:signal transduction histidine kinase
VNTLTYIRLFGFTAGTLLMLFWMVVILGYRRQRNFERVFFFLCLALFLFYSGSLLSINAELYYEHFPAALRNFSVVLIATGLCFFPALLVHLQIEFAETRGLLRHRLAKRIALLFLYGVAAYFSFRYVPTFFYSHPFDFLLPVKSFAGYWFPTWLTIATGFSSIWALGLSKKLKDAHERSFFGTFGVFLFFAAAGIAEVHLPGRAGSIQSTLGTVLALSPIAPLTVLIYYVQKHNFLQIGRQRNLVYAVSITFIALLYLSIIRRISIWMEPILPPEATAAILVFMLVIFFEPLQRLASRLLRATAQSELDRAHRIVGAIQEVSRLGDFAKLVRFVEQWVREQLELAEVKLTLNNSSAQHKLPEPDNENSFLIGSPNRILGTLDIKTYGAMLSGETRVALELLGEQLPAAIDLCKAIEEKLLLERELAERERLALVGQTAASISHNLKNPLGSIKTILQVQLENPEMPESMRGETKIVLEEISRLSAKLNQLLRFSRPAVRSGSGAAQCDAREVLVEAASVLRPQAEQRGISLKVELPAADTQVAATAEALNDIASNLLVNALEAVPSRGHITVSGEIRESKLALFFDDDGPGIPESLREKILQPFFTTKSQGTGLGLAIVARRVTECGGTLSCKSPLQDGRGTRFEISLPRLKAVEEAR